jgi:7-carboxy-7-deazaguanine synthase
MSKPYQVKAIFGPTLQGEGLHAGMPCLFLRLAGCNAWDGRPETRAASACPYCDTDFHGGERLSLQTISARLEALRPPTSSLSLGCVLTGGEPLLQADQALLETLGAAFHWVDIETNGTRPCPPRPANVAISCSPKAIVGQPVIVEPDWWKILIPDQRPFLERCLASGKPVFVQPTAPDEGVVGASYQDHLVQCVQLCLSRGCRLSLQLHKYVGIE